MWLIIPWDTFLPRRSTRHHFYHDVGSRQFHIMGAFSQPITRLFKGVLRYTAMLLWNTSGIRQESASTYDETWRVFLNHSTWCCILLEWIFLKVVRLWSGGLTGGMLPAREERRGEEALQKQLIVNYISNFVGGPSRTCKCRYLRCILETAEGCGCGHALGRPECLLHHWLWKSVMD